jgi:ring-1,2-phenylacetyl-CoA epoxidase subunit PaaD
MPPKSPEGGLVNVTKLKLFHKVQNQNSDKITDLKRIETLKVPPSEGFREAIFTLLEEVCDPEVPVLSILDLGIVRDVKINDDEIEVIITPTYSGCPAMDAISMDIKFKLIENGFTKIKITSVLTPVWTTDWMTEVGKEKLKAYGIAPPKFSKDLSDDLPECPQCKSADTKLLSQFGSTACKALYQCNDCKEPFDYFKCH